MAKGTFERMADILKSNINEVLDRAEDPEKMIRQMIREMEEAVNKATASVGTAVANQKRLERYHNEKASQVSDWQRKAERAVEAGVGGGGEAPFQYRSYMEQEAAQIRDAYEQRIAAARIGQAMRRDLVEGVFGSQRQARLQERDTAVSGMGFPAPRE